MKEFDGAKLQLYKSLFGLLPVTLSIEVCVEPTLFSGQIEALT